MSTDPELPIAGTTEVSLSAERMWEAFADLYWAFNPIRPRYLYKLPAVARIAEFEPQRKVAWEVSMPGFHALHRYEIEPLGGDRCRFGSWEVAEGPTYRRLRRFWLAHFRFVCQASLTGARELAGS